MPRFSYQGIVLINGKFTGEVKRHSIQKGAHGDYKALDTSGSHEPEDMGLVDAYICV
jgi:hypothetical protein